MTAAAPSMPCPVCRTGLVMTERQGIEIDTCPACRGVWLDRGELDKIVERSAPDTNRHGRTFADRDRVPDRRGFDYDDDHGDHYRHHGRGRRKRSFLSELFD